MKKEAIIYQAKSGAIELKGDFSKKTIWATKLVYCEVCGNQSIDEDLIDDRAWLSLLIRITEEALPVPKPKKKKAIR